ncbi:MAG: CAP domain-containing protein [Thermoleophilaceae bacterium]
MTACLLALPVFPSGAKARTSPAVLRAEKRIRACANRQRHLHGLPSVRASRALHRAAHLDARNMARHGFFAHEDPWGRSPGDRIALFSSLQWSWGENIAAGQPSVRSACRAWMHSPGHRANILEPSFKRAGGGFARGGPYGTYFVMELGTPQPR